jgi:hypothetical protein
MSVLREVTVSNKIATSSFVAHTLGLEIDMKTESGSLTIMLKEMEALSVHLSNNIQIVQDRLEVIERKDDGKVQGL